MDCVSAEEAAKFSMYLNMGKEGDYAISDRLTGAIEAAETDLKPSVNTNCWRGDRRAQASCMQRRLPPRKGGGVGAAIGPPHPRGGRGRVGVRFLSVLLCMHMSGVGPAL